MSSSTFVQGQSGAPGCKLKCMRWTPCDAKRSVMGTGGNESRPTVVVDDDGGVQEFVRPVDVLEQSTGAVDRLLGRHGEA